MKKENPDQLFELDELEIESLSDEILESVAGGNSDTDGQNCCSCNNCSGNLFEDIEGREIGGETRLP